MKLNELFDRQELEDGASAKGLVALKKRYDELTDENQHGQAALELSQVLGDSDEVALLKAINARHEKRGSISKGEQTLRDEIANAHYKTMMQGMFPIDETNEGIIEGVALTEEQFDEKAGEKDACYHKVKSRYKVWPSAYASGALVKCRKVGAANWGNKGKK